MPFVLWKYGNNIEDYDYDFVTFDRAIGRQWNIIFQLENVIYTFKHILIFHGWNIKAR